MATSYLPQYWDLCVTCQAATNDGARQCAYCQKYRQETRPPRLNLHFSASPPATHQVTGWKKGRPAWGIYLGDRRLGHVYHNRHEWVYSFTDNPYRLFAARFPATKAGEVKAFTAIADHVDTHPDILRFWLTGREFQYLESSYGAVAAIYPTPLVQRPRWTVKMLITKREREFANARDGLDWAKKVARRYIAPSTKKGSTA